MRKLMYFSLGFAAACALCAYLLPVKVLLQGAAACGTCAVVGLLLFRRHSVPLRLAILLLGCAAGLYWYGQYHDIYLRPAVYLDEKIRPATIRVGDYSYETDYGSAFDGMVIINGYPYQVKTYLKEEESLKPGTEVTGQFRFRMTLPDGEETSAYYPGKGIFLLAIQTGDLVRRQSEENVLDRIALLRQTILEILEEALPADTVPFAKALLLGDGSGLDYKTDTDFKLSGIRHVIAVSGLHVSILFSLISSLTCRRRFLTALFGFPALFLFAALAGFTPSVTRACIMSALMLLAMLAEREYDGPTALSFSGLVMLAVNPLVITAVGFQLSVASVAGIFLFGPPVRKWLLSLFGDCTERRGRAFFANWIASSVSVTVGAMLPTTPLCAVYFGTVSIVGVVTNLLTLWVISFIFYGILAVCLLWHWSASWAAVLGEILAVPIRYVLVTAGILADLPCAAVYTCSIYITVWLVFVYLLLLVFLLVPGKKPGVLLCCMALGLCCALLASWMEPMFFDLQFSVLDVGQGQCILLQYKGNTFLVDCGGDSDTGSADTAAETLLSQGISRLDAVILTHMDRDHSGGAANLLSRVDTDLLILPEEAGGFPLTGAGEVLYGDKNLQLSCADMKIEIFAPEFPGNSNEMSLCILFDTEKCDILITGDRNGFGERSLLRNNSIPQVDILVAGHHGSKHSTCEELLQAVAPEIVCISAGEDNSYGHPAPEVLERLQQHACTVYRTDKHGTIRIRR